MLGRLPEPDRRLLRNAPVNLVVFSLNYETSDAWPPQAGIRWRDGLSQHGFTGKLLTTNQQQLTITPGILPETRVRRGYQLTADNGSTATLYEDGVALEARKYGGWAPFREAIGTVADTAAKQRGITVETSVSLRYVNALSDQRAKTAAYWHDKVQAPFLGPAVDNDLLDDFKRAIYMLSFSDGTINVELRIGVQPDAVFGDCVAFVFDMDVSNVEQCEFVLEDMLGRTDDLNTAALRMFQRVIAPNYLQELTHG